MQNNQSKISVNKTGLGGFVQSTPFFYLVPFAVLMVYLIYITVADKTSYYDGYYLLHQLWNYDKGFISRGFVGEVISWFADTVTPTMIKGISFFGSTLLIAAASLCFGSVLDKTKDDPELHRNATVLIVFLSVLPFSFMSYIPNVGHDKFFWAATLLAVFLSQKKLGIWFTPALCILALLINPLFLLGAMFLIAIILLNECFENGFSAKNIIICAVTYIGIIALGLYDLYVAFPDFENAREMANYFFARYSEPVSEAFINDVADNYLIDFFETKDSTFFFKQISLYFIGWNRGKTMLFNGLAFSFPAMLLLSIFWIKVIKEENKKFGKFIFFLCAATIPMVFPITVVFVWSFTTYASYCFIVQLGLILYFLARKNEAVVAVTGKVAEFCKKHIIVAVSVAVYVAMFINKH